MDIGSLYLPAHNTSSFVMVSTFYTPTLPATILSPVTLVANWIVSLSQVSPALTISIALSLSIIVNVALKIFESLSLSSMAFSILLLFISLLFLSSCHLCILIIPYVPVLVNATLLMMILWLPSVTLVVSSFTFYGINVLAIFTLIESLRCINMLMGFLQYLWLMIWIIVLFAQRLNYTKQLMDMRLHGKLLAVFRVF